MLRNRLLVLASANLVIFAGITLILPLLPDIQKRNGLSTAELGLVAGVAFFSGLVGQLGLARFVDRGYARQLLLTSIALTVGALVVIALSRGLWDLVAGRFLEGLGYAMFAPAAKAIVAAHDPQRVGTNLGRLSGAELAGLVVGPLIGAVLANHFDLRVPFFVLAGAVLLVTPAIIRLDLTGMDVHRESTTPVRALIRRPFVIRAALLYLAMIFPSGVYDVLWAKLLSDRGASLTLIGLSFTIYGIPYVAFAFFGSHLIDRYGAIRSSVIGLLATLPPVILYGYIAAPIGLVLVATIEGAARPCTSRSAPARPSSPPRRRWRRSWRSRCSWAPAARRATRRWGQVLGQVSPPPTRRRRRARRSPNADRRSARRHGSADGPSA